jgi:hypothetical protein
MFNSEGKKQIKNGLINIQQTKFSFFSKSNQSVILIEASSDMFQFDHNRQNQCEKVISFIKSYFDRC